MTLAGDVNILFRLGGSFQVAGGIIITSVYFIKTKLTNMPPAQQSSITPTDEGDQGNDTTIN